MNRSFPAAPAHPGAATIDVGCDGSTPSLPTPACFACRVDTAAMAGDLDPLVEKAVRLVAAAAPTPDAILGPFIAIAALIRSVSFHEGRLLEERASFCLLFRRCRSLLHRHLHRLTGSG